MAIERWAGRGGLLGLALAVAGCATAPEPAPGHDPRTAVVEAATGAIGAPYRYGGEGPRGFDCSGLVRYSYRAAGIHVPRTARRQLAAARPVAASRLRPGDLVFFRLAAGKVSHVGIFIGEGRFVHAPKSGRRVTVSRLDNPYWRRHLLAGARVPSR